MEVNIMKGYEVIMVICKGNYEGNIMKFTNLTKILLWKESELRELVDFIRSRIK
jgi:hypothetical protein